MCDSRSGETLSVLAEITSSLTKSIDGIQNEYKRINAEKLEMPNFCVDEQLNSDLSLILKHSEIVAAKLDKRLYNFVVTLPPASPAAQYSNRRTLVEARAIARRTIARGCARRRSPLAHTSTQEKRTLARPSSIKAGTSERTRNAVRDKIFDTRFHFIAISNIAYCR
jgi:hypothetical protein